MAQWGQRRLKDTRRSFRGELDLQKSWNETTVWILIKICCDPAMMIHASKRLTCHYGYVTI